MTNFICSTCGSEFTASERPPEHCPICEDERQYVNWQGQQWTTMPELEEDHQNIIKKIEPGIFGIGTKPKFAIGQRALLIRSPRGNILWDCVTLLDEETIKKVKKLGGISAIAISHPHYYSSMIEWSEAFDHAPVYLHENDRQWVMRPDPAIHFWNGATFKINNDFTLICSGGHFKGATVMHWNKWRNGEGVLFTGDIIKVAMDRKHVSFMRSYPNYIPLNARAVRNIVDSVLPFDFNRIYGAWFGHVINENAKAAVLRSAERYIQAISE